ncbi:MAG: hypothetical protein WAM69_17455 [Candidatus Sulfotelmatobacter sp.]
MTACSGASTSNSSGNDTNGGNGTPPPNAEGTIVLPNGSSGVAVVHIEDASGNLMSTPTSANIAAAGPVTVLSEPPDFSQGIVAGGQTLQTLNTATTAPQITDNVQLPSDGTPISAAVIADTTFSVVQMSQLTSFATTCFTGGLHLATNQSLAAGQPEDLAFLVSPDGTGMVASGAAGTFDIYALSPVTGAHGENIDWSFSLPGPVPTITGRGAMAWNRASDTVLGGGQDGSLNAISGLKSTPAFNAIDLPGNPAVASITFAPSGEYAIVATASGLFTVSVNSSGIPAVVAGPVDLSYPGSDGQTYQLDQAQSVAITADGNFLVALTDQPSATNGTLVAMPIDASGTVGSVGMTEGGFLAMQGADVLFAH